MFFSQYISKRRLLTGESQIPDTLQTTWSIGYGYNGLGQVVSETDPGPGNVTVNYGVNALGQTTGLTASVGGGAATPLASSASYYPNGALKQFTYGNGIVHTMTQNARQLPSRSTDGTVLDLATAFDANGNVVSVTDYTSAAKQSRTLGYDGLDRLTGASSPMFGTVAYSYDTADNLTRVWIDGGSQPRDHTYCYNTTTNRLDFVRTGPDCASSGAAITLAYDVQGNLSGKNGTAYTFDYGNRLRSTAGLTYRYDAGGRRVRQDSNGGQLKYSTYAKDGRLVWQRDEPAGKRINNVYFAGSLLAEISRPIGTDTATFSYFHTDALGSPIAKTNSAGAVIETSEYEPYGLLLNRANDDRVGYTGHVMDAASGLIYMQQRYYDPAIGRFLSVDPVTPYEKPVTNFNRYVYALNNPYKFTDPVGREVRIAIKRDTYTGSSVTSRMTVTSDKTDKSFSGFALEDRHPGPKGNKDPLVPGEYNGFVRTDGARGFRIELEDTPNFTNVQIHVGNDVDDVMGCFAAGSTRSEDFVGGSKPAMSQIQSVVKADGTGQIKVVVEGSNKPPSPPPQQDESAKRAR